ncbi:aKG-HExxH-type peptide beta-hydroxylase [Streptomyces phaeochromogenes]|uniref:aKG-HExxH-type peptide beta-hydroxylase n=1 Tax=Streptomyces phaeochromogenes TaxID=1923 RepID=UPI002DD7C025|nr:HEXXH motif-containing putative peptide modification protein [Streptomyces phaeochromogenes]WRZ31531.1 HEXXH motif-containing putative peptide modification protein [Streptomyces phaeochromogenes]
MTARKLDVHRLSHATLRSIAAGGASEADLRLLRSAQRSQLLLVLRALLDHVDEAARRTRHHGGVPSGQTAWRLLCAVEERAPDALETALADPTVMAWALRLLRRLGGSVAGIPSAAPLWADLGQFQALAAAAALRAGVPCVLRVPANRGMVWLPGAGMVGPVARRRWSEAEIRVDLEGAVAHGELGHVLLPRRLSASAPGWRPLRMLRDLAPGGDGAMEPGPWLDMVSPYRDFTRYPRFPDRPDDGRLCVWETRLAAAYALLDRESPVEAAALRVLVRAFVPRPLRRAEGGQVASASSLDAFGMVTLSLPHDETQTAAVLVHETRHQQLNALLSLVELVRTPENPGGESRGRRLYYAPWRSDPRPARGLLHGVFAFAGVGRFWRTHRRHVTGAESGRADFEFAVLREQLREAVAELLTGEELTEQGRLFVGEIAHLVAMWQDDEVTAGPAALARHYCALRRAVWRARHLEIPAPVADRFATAWAARTTAPALPPSTLRPRPDLIRLDTFGPLARSRLSAPDVFTRRRRRASRAGEPVLRAGYAAVAGDAEQAALGYAEWTAQDPWDPEAWIGAVLALPDSTRGAGAALLLDRPEAVVGVLRALAAAGGGHPAPADLAQWLGGSSS